MNANMPYTTVTLPNDNKSSTGGSGPSPFGLKVKSFSLSGGVNRTPLNKKELEKRKKLEDEAAAAEAYQDFVETFVTEPEQKKAKMFVRGSLIVPGVSGGTDHYYIRSLRIILLHPPTILHMHPFIT